MGNILSPFRNALARTPRSAAPQNGHATPGAGAGDAQAPPWDAHAALAAADDPAEVAPAPAATAAAGPSGSPAAAPAASAPAAATEAAGIADAVAAAARTVLESEASDGAVRFDAERLAAAAADAPQHVDADASAAPTRLDDDAVAAAVGPDGPFTTFTDTGATGAPLPPSAAVLCAPGESHVKSGRANEDAVCAAPSLGLYVLADGHGPAGAAIALRAVHLLATALLARAPETADIPTLVAALVAAFEIVDAVLRADPRATESGATASVVVVRRGKVVVANIGDSSVYLGGRELSRNHRATDEAEERRVEEAGGSVVFGYILHGNRMLAVTRSFGDTVFMGMSARPSIVVDNIRPGDTLVLGSDGLWEAHYSFRPYKVCGMIDSIVNRGRAENEDKMEAKGAAVDPASDSEVSRRAVEVVFSRCRAKPGVAGFPPSDDFSLVVVVGLEAESAPGEE